MSKKKSSLPKKATVAPLDIFLYAMHFDYSSRHLEQGGLKRLGAMPDGKRKVRPVAGTVGVSIIKDLADLPPTWVPMMVSGLFSAELFLKAILAHEKKGQPPQGHALSELFNAVDSGGQKRIEELFRHFLGEDKLSAAKKKAGADQSLWDLAVLLKRHDEAFIGIRYGYELQSGWEFESILPIRNALLAYCLEVNPTWVAEMLKLGTLPT